MTDNNFPAPNWGKWQHMTTVEIWQAVALSLNVEPSSIPKRGIQQRPASGCIDNFDDRLDVAVNRAFELGPIPMSARGYFWNSKINLVKFAELANECSWSLPGDFPRSTPAAQALPTVAAGTRDCAETKEQRQDRRLQACIDAGLQMSEKAALSRLPNGVGDVAGHEGVSRQTFSTDVKAALKRRASATTEGITVQRR